MRLAKDRLPVPRRGEKTIFASWSRYSETSRRSVPGETRTSASVVREEFRGFRPPGGPVCRFRIHVRGTASRRRSRQHEGVSRRDRLDNGEARIVQVIHREEDFISRIVETVKRFEIAGQVAVEVLTTGLRRLTKGQSARAPERRPEAVPPRNRDQGGI